MNVCILEAGQCLTKSTGNKNKVLGLIKMLIRALTAPFKSAIIKDGRGFVW